MPLLEELGSPYWNWDINDDSCYFSPAFKKWLGYEGRILPNTLECLKNLIFPDDIVPFFEKLNLYVGSNGRLPFFTAVRYLQLNGYVISVVATAVPTDWDGDGKPTGITGFNINMPEDTEKIGQLVDGPNAPKTNQSERIGGWEVDFVANRVNWSKICKEIHEVGEDHQPTLGEALSSFKGESHIKVKNAFDELVATGTPFDLNVLMVTAKGNEIPVRSMGYGIFNDGKCLRCYGTVEDISRQLDAKDHSNVVFEGSTNAHILVGDRGILDCNDAATRIFGCKDKVQLLSQHPSAFSPELQPDGRRSDEKSLEMEKIARERGINCFEWMHRKMDGSDILVEVTMNPIKIDGQPVMLAVLHDITERKSAEEQLKRSEALLNETQRLTHSGSWERDLLAGTIVFSEEIPRIFGIEHSMEGDGEGATIYTDIFSKTIHPADMQLYSDAMKCMLSDSVPYDIEFRILLADDTMKWIRAIGRPHLDKLGKVVKLHGAVSDITKEKETNDALIAAKKQSELSDIAKSQFLATMSHEIRTPMNAVIGFTHLLLRDAREDQMEFLNILRFSGENLLVLINDILDFSKIEAGKIVLEEVVFSLSELMGNIRSALSDKASSKGIKLKLLIDDGIPNLVMGDPVRLGQIVTNLVSNAVKFTENGSVVISVLDSGESNDFSTIYFEVKDTGIGIAEDQRESIFESFTQASSETTRKFGGTGLGLAISRRLLELMDSKIYLESTIGAGSLFYFELKLKKNKVIKPAKKFLGALAGKKSLKNIRMLIADDNHINTLLARELLRQWEGQCDVAENGVEALKLVKDNVYDLVMMDLQMPEMDGYQATEEIRKLDGDQYQTLPIIALTASAMLDIKDRAYAAGMNDYISKPFNPEELYVKIVKYAGHRIDEL